MFTARNSKVVILLICIAALISACSKDKTTEPTAEANPIQMVDVSAIIEQVAPPEYVAPVGSPSTIDSAWLYGDFPLLEGVFGSHEPEALYTNINDFKLSYDILSSTLLVDETGAIILGSYVDSHLVEMENGEIMMHFTAVASALDGPTPVPASAQGVIGTEIDVDYLITVDVTEMPGSIVKIGFTLNDTLQTIAQWDEGTSGDDTQTRLVYSSLDLRDSTFSFRGQGYCQHPINDQWLNGDRFCWAYIITSQANADFSYRMSYTSESTDWSFRYCFLGGGNKDTEFAMKYRPYQPVDATVCDSTWMKDQVFGPNYSEGSGLLTDYDEFLNDDLLFPRSYVPSEMIDNPWAE
ncbi:MAG: hypothetical protein IPH75_11475 [bacterium]|nr:hypothetical protein [bacterium]